MCEYGTGIVSREPAVPEERSRLVLYCEGESLVIELSRSAEKFIGRYARLPELLGEHPILCFLPIGF